MPYVPVEVMPYVHVERKLTLYLLVLFCVGFVGYLSEFSVMYIWDQCFMFGGRAADWKKVLPVVCYTLIKVCVCLCPSVCPSYCGLLVLMKSWLPIRE